MSRAERERWAEAHERWPNLQRFISVHLADCLFSDLASLRRVLAGLVEEISRSEQVQVASEAFSLLNAFKDRQDDRSFLRDAFGVEGKLKTDDRGRGQVGRARIKVVYDALATSVRRDDAGWKPAA